MKCVIISGGKCPSKELLTKEIKGNNYLICADSGANCLYEYDITPNIIIGDFDSVDKKILDHFRRMKCEIEEFPPEKDFTDTELAVVYAVNKGFSEIILLGCTGTRIDHVYANITLLRKFINDGIKIKIVDDHNEIFMSDKSLKIEGVKGDLFSIYSFDNLVEGVSIKGAKYPLENYNLANYHCIGVSNEFEDEVVNISFEKGVLMVIKSKD